MTSCRGFFSLKNVCLIATFSLTPDLGLSKMTSNACADDNDGTCISGALIPRTIKPESFPAVVEVEWGKPQNLDSEAAWKIFEASETYMLDTVQHDPKYEKIIGECELLERDCTFWASEGECESNPTYMKFNCAPVCQSCEMLGDYEMRCSFDETEAIWNDVGHVKHLFEELIRKDDRLDVTVLSRNPWVVTIDNFVSPEECQTLIDWGAKLGYERSEDAGEILEDGTMSYYVNEGRTSTNAWCIQGCFEDNVTQSILARIESLIQVPKENFEYFQLLKYQVGQFYEPHTDYNPDEFHRAQGNRILTVYLYLNDVQRGGGTRFPKLKNGLTVTPKQGRVVIWPSVLDKSPFSEDRRTLHEALPVEKGVKYGANIWVHQRDFQTPYGINCV